MTPDDAIASLERQLAQNGEDIILQRPASANQALSQVKVRAFVRAYRPQELIGTIIQGDSSVTISPASLALAQWPGGLVAAGAPIDQRIPRKNDKCVIQGRARNIEAAAPVYLDGVLVRIDMQVRG